MRPPRPRAVRGPPRHPAQAAAPLTPHVPPPRRAAHASRARRDAQTPAPRRCCRGVHVRCCREAPAAGPPHIFGTGGQRKPRRATIGNQGERRGRADGPGSRPGKMHVPSSRHWKGARPSATSRRPRRRSDGLETHPERGRRRESERRRPRSTPDVQQGDAPRGRRRASGEARTRVRKASPARRPSTARPQCLLRRTPPAPAGVPLPGPLFTC